MRILLLGGSKSGKSMLGQRLTRQLADGGPMIYWATLEPRDTEDRAIVRRHLAERDGWGFETIEQEFAGHGYGDFKQAVGESVVELLRPIREETERLLADTAAMPWLRTDGVALRPVFGADGYFTGWGRA